MHVCQQWPQQPTFDVHRREFLRQPRALILQNLRSYLKKSLLGLNAGILWIYELCSVQAGQWVTLLIDKLQTKRSFDSDYLLRYSNSEVTIKTKFDFQTFSEKSQSWTRIYETLFTFIIVALCYYINSWFQMCPFKPWYGCSSEQRMRG